MSKLPLISILMPSYNHEAFVRKAIQSILDQPYPNFELIIRDDGSTDRTPKIIERLAKENPDRIRYLGSGENVGVSAGWNIILEKAKGKYIVPVASDDVMKPGALEKRLAFLDQHPDVDVLVSDFDLLTKDNREISGPEKLKAVPQFSRFYQIDLNNLYDELLKGNFIPSIGMMIRLDKVKIPDLYQDAECPNLNDYDLWIRLAWRFKWGFLPESTVFYRWHDQNLSSPENIVNHPGRLMPQLLKIFVKQLMEKQNPMQRLQTLYAIKTTSEKLFEITKAEVESQQAPGSAQPPRVSVIIPVFNKLDLTRNCIEKIISLPTEKTPFEIIIVDNGSSDGTAEYLQTAEKQLPGLRIVRQEKNLGFSGGCNSGAALSRCEYLFFLNNDTEPKPGWLDQLVTILDNDPGVAAVGSKLLYPNGNIQHAGVLAVDNRVIGDPLVMMHNYQNVSGDLPNANQLEEYTALTAAALLVRKTAFDLVGRFDMEYWNGYEDVDLCFKLRERGWKLVYQPKSVLIHFESQSGPERFSSVRANITRLHQRWLDKVRPDCIFYGEGREIGSGSDRIRPYQPEENSSAPLAIPENSLTSVIILTYNQLEKTLECLDSLEKYTSLPHEIIVVDNGSKDGTRKHLKTWKKQGHNRQVILNPHNKGFAGGNNLGIRKAKGDYLVLLNNDTVVTQGWLEGLLTPFLHDNSIGLVGPKSNFVAGAQVELHTTYQNEPELQAFAKAYRELFRGKVTQHHRLVGFCLAIRKSVIDRIGLLDERFGKGNYEDDDFSLRASLEGFTMAIAEDTFIHHYGNSSFKANKIDYMKSLEKNRAIFLEKWASLDSPNPILVEILFEEAKLRRELGETDQLEKLLERILSLAPFNKSAAEELYKLRIEQERSDEAFLTLGEYIQANPGDHEAQNALGMQHWEGGEINEAIQSFQLAMENSPGHLDYMKNFADANIAAERFEEGIQMLTHLIKEFPADPESYIKLANLFVEDGNLETAQQWLLQGQQFNQKSPELQDAIVIVQQLQSEADVDTANESK